MYDNKNHIDKIFEKWFKEKNCFFLDSEKYIHHVYDDVGSCLAAIYAIKLFINLIHLQEILSIYVCTLINYHEGFLIQYKHDEIKWYFNNTEYLIMYSILNINHISLQ